MQGKSGVLVNRDTLLQRRYFTELCRLRGFSSMYQYPLKNKDFSIKGELETSYSKPQEVWCILNEITEQKTMRRLGWSAEQLDSLLLISVPYNLEHIQAGCLFTIPAAIDDAEDRLFRVVEMSTIQLYPSSITCRVMPEYKTEVEKSDTKDFTMTTFNLLREG